MFKDKKIFKDHKDKLKAFLYYSDAIGGLIATFLWTLLCFICYLLLRYCSFVYTAALAIVFWIMWFCRQYMHERQPKPKPIKIRVDKK